LHNASDPRSIFWEGTTPIPGEFLRNLNNSIGYENFAYSVVSEI
jgi:hypothetical protein